MANKIYSKNNFHKHTFCIWKEILFAEINDLKISYTSQSGSQYIFTAKGLYRISNHWGRVANCHWRLIPLGQFKSQDKIVGFADWSNFYSNDDTSKLFFIEVNFEKQEASFYHKLSSDYKQNVVIRNAKETSKTIRTIKQVFTETDWAKYLKYTDIESLRKEIINELVTTERSFLEIKKAYLL